MSTELKSGDWVKLKGITRHGKNRINEHGDKWLVEEVSTFSGRPALKLCSANETFKVGDRWIHDGRWVLIKGDMNFEWKKTKGEW